MFQTKVVEKIKTHILWSVTFFFEHREVKLDNVETFCTAGQATDDNMAACALLAGYLWLQMYTQLV
jgi:hypothetical protein